MELGAELELGPRTFNNLGFLSSLHWLAMQIRSQVLLEVCGLFALAGNANRPWTLECFWLFALAGNANRPGLSTIWAF